jgi:hypothetical protein
VKIESGRVLDRLVAEERCLGAVFTSYGFDPAFFEDHALRAVLRLTSDPVEQATRYHGEARRALQETPVVTIVDAGERRPGRRLPYDVLEVSEVVFHPKSALLLYPKRARLMVGSGNLTFAGYGGNTELFLCLDLAYDDAHDASLLRSFDAHLIRIGNLARQTGTQLKLFREELARRLSSETEEPVAPRMALLDSTTSPIIEQLAAMLPGNAVIDSIGMLAPFYERDDGGELDVTSVFGALAPKAAKDAVLDVAVAWDNAQVFPDTEVTPLENGLNRLWAWGYDSEGTRVVEYLVPTSLARNTLGYLDETGRGRRWPIEEARGAVEDRSLWMLPTPEAHAPRRALEAARKRFADVRVWLHPATRLLEGQPVHRPLHAKLLLVGFHERRSRGTLVLMGSPNMSRRALLLSAGPNRGNVELGLAFCLEGSLSLRDVVPELILAPASAIELREHEFPELGPNYALAIDEAIHDPSERTLVVKWDEAAADLPAWRLSYDGTALAHASDAPSADVVVSDFVLQPASAEVILHVKDVEYTVPILVTDLVALPVAAQGPGLGLDELLMLLGRRLGSERAIEIAERRTSEIADDDELVAFFGEGFVPTDVFRAWWAVADELRDPGLSVQAFRLRLEGALGVLAAWSLMLDAMRQPETLQPAEVWFYGAELLRTLAEVVLPTDADGQRKGAMLAELCSHVRDDLSAIALDSEAHPWLRTVHAFYEEARA